MLRPILKIKETRKNRFSVNTQNLLYTIFCQSTRVLKSILGANSLNEDFEAMRHVYQQLNPYAAGG